MNAENIGDELPFFDSLYYHLEVDILTFTYRGYPDSTGEPSEVGLKSDAHAIMKYLKEQFADTYVDKGGIFLLGRSLGGAVATEAITNESKSMIDGIVLENTFTSIPDMVDHLLGLPGFVTDRLLRNRWMTVDKMPEITTPVLLVTGDKD